VADDDDNERGRPAAAREAAGDAEAPTGARRRRKTPIWRTGRFWVVVILAEVALALVVSFALERSPDSVDLAGGDLPAFCAQVRTVREEVAAAGTGDAADPTRFERERDAYRSLVAVAPPDLVPDLELLAELDEDIIETVQGIAARRAEDPSSSGLAELTAALDRASAEGRVAGARVDVVLREGCGMTPEELAPAPDPTTTLPAEPVPGSSPP
jgi:hypothetical protein